jgi:putative ATP-dependent endonuclease of OLD family
VHIESLTLTNFRCFGPEPERINLDASLTALIGSNGTGKTAACHALQRVFGISTDERTLRPDDFHVPANETDRPASRSLRIEVVIAFPELDDETQALDSVPSFFEQLTVRADGAVKCRIVLDADWIDDSTLDGSVETRVHAVSTLDPDYDDDHLIRFPPSERSRIQFVYVPASRDGARHLATFLKGRVWRSATWSHDFKTRVEERAEEIGALFQKEKATTAVEREFKKRWQELHSAGTHSSPEFTPLEQDWEQFLRNAELRFSPDPSGQARSVKQLSDGQRSLVHLALTAASLDIERQLLTDDSLEGFDLTNTMLPSLTVLAVEEPENNLAPFYLSRIIGQLLELGESSRAQVLLSSHSASALTRINPTQVRHFRSDETQQTSTVRAITLPEASSDAATYVREAVRAHPELYFARFVVLGEGDSEQLVIPAVAEANDIDLDPAFVAMVPLGGRHTNHFWKLLDDLRIPHATLLDLDYGRSGGGAGRVRTALSNLRAVGVEVLDELDPYDTIESITDDLTLDQLRPLLAALERLGVFFSSPLDLDMSMLVAFWDVYTRTDPSQTGPHVSSAVSTVLGSGHPDSTGHYWQPADAAVKETRDTELRWYRYLFTNRSKPGTHLQALANLKPDRLRNAPQELLRLVGFLRQQVDSETLPDATDATLRTDL